jgi:negative regulator of flagellin synthesis FlgM
MDIRNNLDGLRSLLGVNAADPAASQVKNNAAPAGSAWASDQATLSSAGSEVSQAAADTGARMDKVAGIQAALASGSYNIPAPAVASKVVEAMLGGEQ